MKGKTSGTKVVVAVVVLAIVAFFAMGSFNGNSGQAFQVQSPVIINQGGQQAGGCNVNPSVVTAVTDTLSPGSSVGSTPTIYYRLNGQYVGTTSPTVLGTYDALVTNSSFISKIHPGFQLGCGSNYLTDNLYLLGNATETVYSNSGLTTLTNSATGGTYNETPSTTSAYTWKLHLVGQNLKATGPLMLVVELSSPVNVSDVSLSGGTPLATIPKGYSSQLTGSYIKSFSVPGLVGNEVKDLYLTATPTSSKAINTTVYTTLYYLQPFLETDGTFNTGTAPFDSQGNAKYSSVMTYNWKISTS